MKVAGAPKLFDNEVLKSIAAAKNITTAQVILAWAINRGTAAIPKSASPERQRENLAAADVELSESEMTAIAELDLNFRYVDGTFWEHADGPYTAAGVWA